MTPTDDPADVFRNAERRLRGLLFGDGVYASGVVKGEELRSQVNREVRRMREAFAAAVAAGAEGRDDVESPGSVGRGRRDSSPADRPKAP